MFVNTLSGNAPQWFCTCFRPNLEREGRGGRGNIFIPMLTNLVTCIRNMERLWSSGKNKQLTMWRVGTACSIDMLKPGSHWSSFIGDLDLLYYFPMDKSFYTSMITDNGNPQFLRPVWTRHKRGRLSFYLRLLHEQSQLVSMLVCLVSEEKLKRRQRNFKR